MSGEKSLQSTYRGMRIHILERGDNISLRITYMSGPGGGLISIPSSLRGRLVDSLEMAVTELKKWNT